MWNGAAADAATSLSGGGRNTQFRQCAIYECVYKKKVCVRVCVNGKEALENVWEGIFSSSVGEEEWTHTNNEAAKNKIRK